MLTTPGWLRLSRTNHSDASVGLLVSRQVSRNSFGVAGQVTSVCVDAGGVHFKEFASDHGARRSVPRREPSLLGFGRLARRSAWCPRLESQNGTVSGARRSSLEQIVFTCPPEYHVPCHSSQRRISHASRVDSITVAYRGASWPVVRVFPAKFRSDYPHPGVPALLRSSGMLAADRHHPRPSGTGVALARKNMTLATSHGWAPPPPHGPNSSRLAVLSAILLSPWPGTEVGQARSTAFDPYSVCPATPGPAHRVTPEPCLGGLIVPWPSCARQPSTAHCLTTAPPWPWRPSGAARPVLRGTCP